MDERQFKSVLEKAVAGDRAAIEKILKLYAPLINRSAHINGVLDEDLRQYILMHIIKKISKFKL